MSSKKKGQKLSSKGAAKPSDLACTEEEKDTQHSSIVPFWSLTDLDKSSVCWGFAAVRLVQALFFTFNMLHPDEYWQAVEPAYNMVYGGVELTWEWDPSYRLRSTIYPTFLAIPLYVLKITGMDCAAAVRACPEVTHMFLVIVCDHYFWKIGKQTVGKNATRVAFLILAVNRLYTEIITRCFSNSIETIFQTIAFYYFL